MARPMARRWSPIDARLKELGKDRAWLAKECGVSVTWIGKLARREAFLNTSNPRNLLAGKVRKALGVDNNYLVFGRK